MSAEVTSEMVEAALDKWYLDEDWKKTCGESLVGELREEMRAALVAALKVAADNGVFLLQTVRT